MASISSNKHEIQDVITTLILSTLSMLIILPLYNLIYVILVLRSY